MTSALISLATFASPIGRLLGDSFNLKLLRDVDSTKIDAHSAATPAILDAVTITAIAYSVAETAETSKSVTKATFVGLISYLIAVIAARFAISPAITRLCKPCSPFGRFGVGIVVLVSLAIALVVVVSMLRL